MNFRLFSHKRQLYTNSPNWPSNQRTWSEWALSPDGSVLELVFSVSEGGDNLYYNSSSPVSCEMHDKRDFVVEAWTGYFDSKGKKIYRGDVLLLDCYNLAYEIDWKQDRFVMKPLFEASGEIPDHFRDHKDISTNWSVVWNIHKVEYND